MYYIAAIVFLLLAVGAWISTAAPFIRDNREDAGPQYMGWLIGIFYHFFFALWIGFSYKKKIPLGVYGHGVFLVMAFAFGVAGTLSD